MATMTSLTVLLLTINLLLLGSSTLSSSSTTPRRTINVNNAGQLNDALNSVNPGDTIQVADGYYSGAFTTTRSGTIDQAITITGSRNAILSGGNTYGFWLKANYWVVRGLTFADSLKGLIVEGGNFNNLDDIEVRNIRQEGVHFRWGSSDNVLQNSYVHHTGQGSATDQGYGEGVYMGQAVNNWQNGQPDRSDRNQVLNNQIGPNVAAEPVDVKEGSCCGVIQGNHFIGPQLGQNYATCFVNVKGDNYLVEGNRGENPLTNGFGVYHINNNFNMGGCNNRIINNQCSGIPGNGHCIDPSSYNCNNEYTGNTG